ncbi:MAG: redoxin family protein, partial [Bacteroidia bacterium]|nr:redoxin family protein [Bacteroidia bacterium]
MKSTIILSLFFLCAVGQINAQLADGDTAPNFSLDDLQGNTWDLYDVLDQGYSVVLDFSATWCGPCWNYHQTGILEDLYDNYGPGGTDQVMVFMIEADPNTTQPCIYGPSGCSGGSIGDWTAGVTYPILNPPSSEASAVNNDFNINYYPTLYGIAPNKKVYEVGQASSSEWENWLLESFQMVFSTAVVQDSDCFTSGIDLMVNGGYGAVDYDWSNGSDEQDQTDLENDEYYVTLSDSNGFEFEMGPIEVDNQNIAEVMLVDAQDLLCNNDFSGYLEVEMDGGSGNFVYDWSNGATTPVLDGIDGGDYELEVTDLDSGCQFDFDYFIDEPDELVVETEVENAECGGNGIGEVDFIVDGGTYPFTFTFEDFETTNDFITIEAGEYDVTVSDGNGCETFVQFTVEVDEAPLAMAQALGSFNCLTDTVWVNADSSSVGNFIEYNWFDPTNNFVGSGFQVQVDSAGIYTLEVYD